MTESALLATLTHTIAGLALGLGYRALRLRSQERASRARHPELVVLGSLIGRILGLTGLVFLISRGAIPALVALAAGFGLARLANRTTSSVTPGNRTGFV